MRRVRAGLGLAKEVWTEFGHDQGPRLAAALAYYTVFSLPPLLIVVTAITGAFVEPREVEGVIITQAGELIGPEGGRQIRTMIQEAGRPEPRGLLLSILGAGALVFGATGAFVQLQAALNAVWGVERRKGGIKGFLLKRLFSFGMVMALGFLLLVSLVVTAVVSGLGGTAVEALPTGAGRYVAIALPHLLELAVIALLFAAIFKVVPDAKVSWKDVRTGALVTAFLFVAGKFLLGFHLGRSDPGSAYGAAGSLALVLVWIYYSAIIMLLGAEFTQVWARRRGKPIRPSPGAIRVRKRRIDEADGTLLASIPDEAKAGKLDPEREHRGPDPS